MPTPRETILAALQARLSALAATALRGEVLPERVPAEGLLILRDGEPGDPEMTLSPLRYHYQHRAEIEAVVQGAARDTAFDTLTASIGAALVADRTLGGLCDWSSAGTPAALELKRFGLFNGAITRNGPALGNVVSAEITYANNLDRIETIRNDGRIDGADPSIAALTGRIEVRFADQTLMTQAIYGEAREMEFAYVLPSGESFTFTVHAVYLPRPRIEISGPQGVQATFDWQAARDSVVGRMCTATLMNDLETY